MEYKGRVLARAHPSGNRASHCAGITFKVFFKAMQQRNSDLGLDPGDFNRSRVLAGTHCCFRSKAAGLGWWASHSFCEAWVFVWKSKCVDLCQKKEI
ncbi:MAG: hypothetical protein AB1441_05835 [Bacillota bacterium]